MRLCVFGNCQADILASLLRRRLPGAEIFALPPNYLMTDADAAGALGQMDTADFIFAQRVGDEFATPWIRSASLRERLGDRLVVWPNVYFDGYYPDVRYVYLAGWGKLQGPLDDYHFGTIIDQHGAGASVATTTALLSGRELVGSPADPFAASVAALREREREADVAVSDFLAARVGQRACFYTPNHPHGFVLDELAARLCRQVGLPWTSADAAAGLPELDRIQIAPHAAVIGRYGLHFAAPGQYRGVTVERVGERTVALGGTAIYDVRGLVEAFYRIYDVALRA